MAFVAAFLVILIASPVAFGAQHQIDWKLGTDYSEWTTKSVSTGDTLVFTYDNTHTVDVVSKADYDSCSAANPSQTNTKSPTTITLKEGTTYIICGTQGHCPGGMKLQVTAKASGSGSGSTPSSPTPSGSPSGTETPSGSGTSPPSPSGNGAGGFSSIGHLMVAIPLVLGTLFAFLG